MARYRIIAPVAASLAKRRAASEVSLFAAWPLPLRRSGCVGPPRVFASADGAWRHYASDANSSASESPPSDDSDAATRRPTTADAPVYLRPPGAGQPRSKVISFLKQVSDRLVRGERLEIEARGPGPLQTVLRALALGKRTADFEVSWAGQGGGGTGGDRSLCFLACAGPEWGDYMRTNFRNVEEFFVQSGTDVRQLAKAISTELFENGVSALRVHTFVEDEAALSVLVKALATAHIVRWQRQPLTCTPSIVSPVEGRARIFVFVRPAAFEKAGRGTIPARSAPRSTTAASAAPVFVATPPGRDAAEERVQSFTSTVHDRLYRGDIVEMECRGPQAVENGLRALCTLQGNTAEAKVSWTSGIAAQASAPVGPSMSRSPSFIRLRARAGGTWADFGSTDFSHSAVHFAAPASNVETLAIKAAEDLRAHGSVSLRAYSDNQAAINTAAKAMASLSLQPGIGHCWFVPSLGYTTSERLPVLRLFVRHEPPQTASDPGE